MKCSLKLICTVFFFLIISHHLFAQDLTGTWEGQKKANGKSYNYTYYFSKVNNGYAGVIAFKEALINVQSVSGFFNSANANSSNLNIKIDPLKNKAAAKLQMVASFGNGVLSYTDLGLIASNTQNVRLDKGEFTYEQSKGKEKLISREDPSFTLTKKSNDFPAEFAQYKNDVITVSNISFVNSNKGDKIKYNDKGTLSFTLANNTGFDLQGINFSMAIREQNSGILGLDGNSGTFSLAKSGNISPPIDLTSGFNLPAAPVHLTVVCSYNGIVLFSKELELNTIPFYLTDKTVISPGSEKVLGLLKGNYGLDHAPYSSIAANLDQFVASGNKFAPMWKAAFLTRGKGGYPQSEGQAQPFAAKAYNDVLEGARNGDAECQYLMFYAVGLGLAGEPSREVAGAFLRRSAEAGFLPAMYDYALFLMKEDNYEESYKYLNDCYDRGMQRAMFLIGYFNEKGYAIDKDSNKAIEWYHKGEAFGDADAIMELANMYSSGEGDIEPNAAKAMGYAAKAADLKNPEAMDFMAKVYLNGRSGVPKNIMKAIELYKQAGNLGDNQGMTSLAILYFNGSDGIQQDPNSFLYWARKSAEAGGADCMVLLSNAYGEGKIIPKDIIKARFWHNQAVLNGVGTKDKTAENVQKVQLSDFVSNLDFSDHYSYFKDEEGNIYERNDGSNLVGSMAISLLGIWLQRQSEQQEVIDGLEYIYTSGGKKIYGGTLSSNFATNVYLKAGQQIKIKAYGSVNLGTFAGVSSPNGITGFQSYCVDPSIPHGSVMAGTVGKWSYIGVENTYTASQEGKLQLAINDADYTNNKGYFDVVVTTK